MISNSFRKTYKYYARTLRCSRPRFFLYHYLSRSTYLAAGRLLNFTLHYVHTHTHARTHTHTHTQYIFYIYYVSELCIFNLYFIII